MKKVAIGIVGGTYALVSILIAVVLLASFVSSMWGPGAVSVFIGICFFGAVFAIWLAMAVGINRGIDMHARLKESGLMGRAIFKKRETNDSLDTPANLDEEDSIFPEQLI